MKTAHFYYLFVVKAQAFPDVYTFLRRNAITTHHRDSVNGRVLIPRSYFNQIAQYKTARY